MLFCTRLAWVCLVCLLLCKEEYSSLVSLQLLTGGYGPVWDALVYNFVGFWDGDYVIAYVWYVGVKSSFQHAREESKSKRAYVFNVTDV